MINKSTLRALAENLILSATSDVIDMSNGRRLAIQVEITTEDLEGSMAVQSSLDNITYITDATSIQAIASANIDVLYEVADPTAQFYRVVITRISGTYDLTIQSLVSGG